MEPKPEDPPTWAVLHLWITPTLLWLGHSPNPTPVPPPHLPTPTESWGFKRKLPNSGPRGPSVPSVPTAPHPQPVGSAPGAELVSFGPRPVDTLPGPSLSLGLGTWGRAGSELHSNGTRWAGWKEQLAGRRQVPRPRAQGGFADGLGRGAPHPRACSSSRCHGLPRGRESSYSQLPQFHRKPGTTNLRRITLLFF